MQTLQNIAAATALSLTLLTGFQAFAGTDSQSQTQSSQTQSGDQSTPYGGAPLTADQMSSEYQHLSPATRAALANQLKSKGIDGLSKMSESDARTAFAGLPPDVKAQIQSKWDSLSDEQRIALKRMGPSAVKELVASGMKEVMKQSMAPVTKPVEQVVEKAQSAVVKAQNVMQAGRDYVQGFIAKLKAQAAQRSTTVQAEN
jgi:hypothetical protein